tara:strand:+ start:29586 stop:32333 length:2748 start_codon:yes stop_codon:yes gene_type:complete
MAIVVIAEKPSVANDIAGVLGINKKMDTHWDSDDVKITWAVGHLLQLKYMDDYDADFKDWRKTVTRLPFIPEDFQYKPINGRNKKQLQAITKLIKDKSTVEIVNACDAAREGELIFRTIVGHSKSKVKTSRMWLQSMTKDSIQKAWDERLPGENYTALMDAAYSRSESDWVIGMNGSRIANSFLPRKRNEKSAISLGRVQTATLAMIVDHEIIVLSHSPVPYWQLSADFSSGGCKWNARWERTGHKDDEERPEYKSHRIIEQEEYERLKTLLKDNHQATITQTTREYKEKNPLNFDLTSLQRSANNLWSWTAKRTLRAAQDLYDRFKLTTYPRTDSKYLPENMKEEISKTIRQLGAQEKYTKFSKNLTENGLKHVNRNFNDKKVSDHFAIIPTGKIPDMDMSEDHKKLYDLIVRNFISSWYPEAVWNVEKRIASIQNESFHKEVRTITTPGWREVQPKKSDAPEGWGALKSTPCEGLMTAHEFKEEKSKPKGRLKEAGLLRLMEHAGRKLESEEMAEAMKEKGLGTPATRAETIEKLIDRDYIRRAKAGTISATAHGIRIIDTLRRIPVEWITSAELTGEMEASLIDVQKGNTTKKEFMDAIVEKTTSLVERIRDHDRSTLYQDDSPLGKCPKCDGDVNETVLSYICSENKGKGEGCSFVFWKDTSGRWFDRSTAKRLLEEREIEELHGFFGRNGEGYTNSVTLSDEGKVESKNGGESKSSSEDEKLCICPVCNRGSIRINSTMYACDDEDCTFRGLSHDMCKRPISKEEAKDIFTDGKSKLLDDFVSRKGRPFKAFLVLDNNRVKFEFPPREASSDARKFKVTPGVVAVCPKTKVEIIETETFYQPATVGTDCLIQIAREISKREITRDEAKQLIEKGEVGPFDDFVAKKTGNNFSAVLFLKKNQSVGYRFAKK